MARKINTEEFIRMARVIHGDKYDYSKSLYTKRIDKLVVICYKHGEFSQTAKDHLAGCGCPKCFKERNKDKGLICGIGLNDIGQSDIQLFTCWRGMLYRCYGKKPKGYNKSYIGCTVVEDWHKLSEFSKWYYNNYVEGWQLDKDILSNREKIYSPKTCCFVPNEINMAFTKSDSKGVTFIKQAWQASYAGIYLGRFQTQMEAQNAYCKAKSEHIYELAERYKEQLREDVYIKLKEHALRLCGLNDIADNFKI